MVDSVSLLELLKTAEVSQAILHEEHETIRIPCAGGEIVFYETEHYGSGGWYYAGVA